MSVVDTSIVIAAPPRNVWDVVMDPHQLSRWVTIHRRVEDVSRGEPTEGYRMTQTMQLRGASFNVRWLLVECDPGRRALWEGHGPARSRARIEYELVEENGGTRFHYRNEFQPPLGPLGAAAARALIGGISEREAKRSLERLKQLVEEHR